MQKAPKVLSFSLRVSGTVDSPLAVGVQVGASRNLRLHSHEHILADNGFVAAFHTLFRPLAIIGTALLVQNVDREGLLQQGITNVFFVGQNLLNATFIPFAVA